MHSKSRYSAYGRQDRARRSPRARRLLRRRGGVRFQQVFSCLLTGTCADRAGGNRLQRAIRGFPGAPFREHAHDGAHDTDIAGAAAQIAAQFEAHPFGGSVWQAQHDVTRRHQHSGRAEATLQAVLFRESAPQRVHHDVLPQSLDRTDRGAVAHHRIGDAGACRVAVQQQGACTTRALLAPQMRGRQAKSLS